MLRVVIVEPRGGIDFVLTCSQARRGGNIIIVRQSGTRVNIYNVALVEQIVNFHEEGEDVSGSNPEVFGESHVNCSISGQPSLVSFTHPVADGIGPRIRQPGAEIADQRKPPVAGYIHPHQAPLPGLRKSPIKRRGQSVTLIEVQRVLGNGES